MSYGVTPQGWLSKPFSVIRDELVEELELETGKKIPSTPDSVVGQILNIFAAEVADNYDVGQVLTDNIRLSKAQGVYLDYIGEGFGLRRLRASGSTGELLFKGNNASVVPINFPVKDGINRNVLTTESVTITSTACYTIDLKVSSVVVGDDYRIEIEGVSYSYTATGGDTKTNILENLSLVINGKGITSSVANETITITNNVKNNNLTFNTSPNIFTTSVGALCKAESATTGALSFPAESIDTLVGVAIGVNSVINPSDFTLGRFREDDEEFRLRIRTQKSNTGTATKPAIEASLRNIVGVTAASIVENEEVFPVNGIPEKGFIAYVSGGDEQKIAETIFNTKATTIKTGGDILRIVEDSEGNEVAIRFSRNPIKYAWVRVTYTLNDEEVIPSQVQTAIKQSIVNYGSTRYSGEDFVNTKLYKALYTDVSGVFFSNIEIAVTSTSSGTPSYTTAVIPISDVENLEFSEDRVVFV
ncbi:putative baseplate component [Vibrio phage ICP1]|nr:putative baseplate component [Vibrio phage ICP1]QVW07032.1 putative baseplate component [Vibrio phage ICP1]QVW07253.1 putative baseplate component [Vibrio phage ICP1]QVW07475.1 putative baseplate component [Vibrio phage ICP1]QVW08598.1 putative baseplate component [Vibrio phage ICP1]